MKMDVRPFRQHKSDLLGVGVSLQAIDAPAPLVVVTGKRPIRPFFVVSDQMVQRRDLPVAIKRESLIWKRDECNSPTSQHACNRRKRPQRVLEMFQHMICYYKVLATIVDARN